MKRRIASYSTRKLVQLVATTAAIRGSTEDYPR